MDLRLRILLESVILCQSMSYSLTSSNRRPEAPKRDLRDRSGDPAGILPVRRSDP